MAFVENTDALIIDVRRNGGGGRVVIDFLSSYFLGPNPVHLNSVYNGIQNYTEEFWTQAELPGERYGTDKPLYILTSKRTFSAAEEFSYNLKHLDRAVIVGEQTGGGAHPITIRRLTDEFVLRLPIARSINPVTGTNWEGTGVTPDNEVSAEEALKAAHLEALKSIARTSSEGKKEIKKLIEELEREMGAQKGGE
jgi:C-terminal processing protease CtpA/Prc